MIPIAVVGTHDAPLDRASIGQADLRVGACVDFARAQQGYSGACDVPDRRLNGTIANKMIKAGR